MIILQYDYYTVEQLFGTFVADNFSWIFPIVGSIVVVIILRLISRFGSGQKDEPEIRNGWAYNESARIWVDPDQLDEEKKRRAYEENRRRWKEFQEREALDEIHAVRMQELRAQQESEAVILSPEELRQAEEIWKKHQSSKAPSYEEWKAAKLKEQDRKESN